MGELDDVLKFQEKQCKEWRDYALKTIKELGMDHKVYEDETGQFFYDDTPIWFWCASPKTVSSFIDAIVLHSRNHAMAEARIGIINQMGLGKDLKIEFDRESI